MGFKFPRASDTVVAETELGKQPSAGKLRTYSRGDHTHGTVIGDLLPQDDNLYDLGSLTRRWRNLYLSALARFGVGDLTNLVTIDPYQILMEGETFIRMRDDNAEIHLGLVEDAIIRREVIAGFPYFTMSNLYTINALIHAAMSFDDNAWVRMARNTEGLPAASEGYRGMLVRTEGTGGSGEDELWHCIWDGSAYTWKKVTLT